MPRVAVNNLHAKCDVINKAEIFSRIEIVFTTLKPAVKRVTVERNLH